MSRSVVVEHVLWADNFGGAIFNGSTADGAVHRFVAKSSIMPRAPLPGEVWEISGLNKKDRVHGPQVEVNHCVLQRPSGQLIIKALSSSKRFPGIGDVTARKLWAAFGEDLYALLDQGDTDVFAGCIGMDLAEALVFGWRELHVEASVYRWLSARAAPLWLANKLIAIYGNETIAKLEENPYRLLAFTSWTEADRLARAAGVLPEDERRLAAAADAAVYFRLRSHHTWSGRSAFKVVLGTLLGQKTSLADESFRIAVRDRAVVEVNDGVQGLGPYSMEVFIADKMAEIARGDFQSPQMTMRQAPEIARTRELTAKYERGKGLTLNERQKTAVNLAITAPIAVVTGGAGVGKTTVLSAICELSEALGTHVYQLALSGRAARRMEEATGRPAQTIASWISAVDAGKVPLDTEPTIAIDESSMLDLPTTYRILRRLQPGCRLLLLGDPGQLPPIGFGIVFHDVVNERAVPQVELTEIMRQAASTGIPQVSRDVRAGGLPTLCAYAGEGPGVSFIPCDQDDIVNTLMDVVNDLGGVHTCQIIGATKNGPAGVKTINHAFHQLLSSGKRQLNDFAAGEPVIWLRNDYDFGLLNGSLGTVVRADKELVVDWSGEGEKSIEPPQLRDMDLAYAITVHKAQGSQFPRVVVPIYKNRLLDRTLIYTALTRAQHQVVLVGDRKAFEAAVENPPTPSLRQTGIRVHLAHAFSSQKCSPR